jgi:glutathione S-transferase
MADKKTADVEIISSATCPFAQRTRMALIEKGIDFDLTAIDLNDKPDWFLKISPYGKVPVLRHNDAVIFESAVINEYLEEVFPARPLMPSDPVRRAQARIWIDFANVRFTPHVYKLMLAQDAEAQAAQAERLTNAMLMMEHAGLGKLGDGSYWMGDEISLVDLTFLPHMQRVGVLTHYSDFQIPDECILLKGWMQLMGQRASVTAGSAALDVLIENWRKYAENTSTGTTAADMRAA